MSERERQRASRARAAARASPSGFAEDGGGARDADRHVPASASIPAEIQKKLLVAWDKNAALSRASLLRDTRAILRTWGASGGLGGDTGGALSRAGHFSQEPVTQGELPPILEHDVTRRPGLEGSDGCPMGP